MIEEWRDIEGYVGLYQVSNLGNVRALNYGRKGITRVMSIADASKGYKQICLTKNNRKSSKKIHRLVAQAFIPNPNGYKEINHKDEDKTNNCVDNLEWCSAKYNVNFGTRMARISKEIAQYDMDGHLIRIWQSSKDAERGLGFSRREILRVCSGEKESAYGYRWEQAPERGKHIEVK